jgi:hypothetical protein
MKPRTLEFLKVGVDDGLKDMTTSTHCTNQTCCLVTITLPYLRKLELEIDDGGNIPFQFLSRLDLYSLDAFLMHRSYWTLLPSISLRQWNIFCHLHNSALSTVTLLQIYLPTVTEPGEEHHPLQYFPALEEFTFLNDLDDGHGFLDSVQGFMQFLEPDRVLAVGRHPMLSVHLRKVKTVDLTRREASSAWWELAKEKIDKLRALDHLPAIDFSIHSI